MDHLVLIAEGAVRDHCGGDAPQRQNNPGEARLIADNELCRRALPRPPGARQTGEGGPMSAYPFQ
jgi:hypothetical protein